MRHFAVVGSGPAGFYTAEALEKAYGGADGNGARIDILDRYPVPYGLIRFGVAPDHQSLKAVSKRYDKVAESAGTDFIGNVAVGRDVSVDELLELYDAVVLATGAPHDRKLGIPGEDLAGVVGSAEFVGWYNGHPDFADLDPPLGGQAAVVVGNGNVALDCARILC
jgi:NADPH-dependent glutamate synthase beta subunit-like oxidoreductase